MTDDLKPEYETPPPDPLPAYGEGEESVYTGELSPSSNEILSEVETVGYDLNNGAGDYLEPVTEAVTDEDIASKADGESIWTRLRRAVLGGANRVDDRFFMERIRHLDEAIEAAPETPANYVLRGELYLSAGEYELAGADFQRGYELAAQQFETSDWGVMAQAMQDRALAGLEKVEKKMRAISC